MSHSFNATQSVRPDGWRSVFPHHRHAKPASFVPPSPRPWRQPREIGLLDNHESGDELEKIAEARAFALRYHSAKAQALADTMLPYLPLKHLKFTMASPLAMRVARDRIIAAALPVLEDLAEAEQPYFTTVILPKWFFPIGELENAHPTRIREALRQQILRIGARHPAFTDGLLMGCLEVSLRTDVFGQPAGWQVHWHFVAGPQMTFILRKLRSRQFGDGPSFVKIPVLACPIRRDRLARSIGYTLKFQVRRQNAACSKSTGDCGPAFPHELPGDVAPEALLWLNRWRLADLLLVKGTRCLASSLRMSW